MNNRYILFGAGREGIKVLKFFGEENVGYFCDNGKSGQLINGKEVISFVQLKEIHTQYKVVITTSVGRNMVQIALQLDKFNIPFSLFEDEAKNFLEQDLLLYNSLNQHDTFKFNQEYAYPVYLDKVKEAGTLTSYFWQDLWAAQRIFQHRPKVHCDIGSRVDGFIAHLLSFGQKVKLFDIRPLNQNIAGVDFVQCDATNLENIVDESIESLSALCSLEHFGLGRYGDPIDPEACFKCFAAIQRKIKKNGKIYISVPIGRERLEFNAHRVFYADTIVQAFEQMKLLEYSATCGKNIEYSIDIHTYDNHTEKGGDLFGLFVFEKK